MPEGTARPMLLSFAPRQAPLSVDIRKSLSLNSWLQSNEVYVKITHAHSDDYYESVCFIYMSYFSVNSLHILSDFVATIEFTVYNYLSQALSVDIQNPSHGRKWAIKMVLGVVLISCKFMNSKHDTALRKHYQTPKTQR